MKNALKNRVGLITGAGGGIGRTMAVIFARHGCKVVVSDLNEITGRETVEQIRAEGGEASFFAADVGSEEHVKALVKFAVDTYGGLNVAVNNAGIEAPFVQLHELSIEDWDKVIRIDLTGVFLCLKHEILHMRNHGGGSIVNISSVAATQSVTAVHAYAAAKRGVLSLTSCAAIEAGPQNIRVNAIMPGAISTRMLEEAIAGNPSVVDAFLKGTPLGHFGKTDDIAEAALWLTSDASNYVTGQYLAVDGGITA